MESSALVAKRCAIVSGAEEDGRTSSRDNCVIRQGSSATPRYMFHLLQSLTSDNYLVSI